MEWRRESIRRLEKFPSEMLSADWRSPGGQPTPGGQHSRIWFFCQVKYSRQAVTGRLVGPWRLAFQNVTSLCLDKRPPGGRLAASHLFHRWLAARPPPADQSPKNHNFQENSEDFVGLLSGTSTLLSPCYGYQLVNLLYPFIQCDTKKNSDTWVP